MRRTPAASRLCLIGSLPLRTVLAGLTATIVAMVSGALAAQGAEQNNSKATLDHVEGELLISFRGNPKEALTRKLAALLGAVEKKHFKTSGCRLWKFGNGVTTKAALGRFTNNGLLGTLDLVEPNYIFHATDLLPNDPGRGQLWGMHNIGQTGGTLRADISALGAWGIRSRSRRPASTPATASATSTCAARTSSTRSSTR